VYTLRYLNAYHTHPLGAGWTKIWIAL
jgi:hypothetical protein